MPSTRKVTVPPFAALRYCISYRVNASEQGLMSEDVVPTTTPPTRTLTRASALSSNSATELLPASSQCRIRRRPVMVPGKHAQIPSVKTPLAAGKSAFTYCPAPAPPAASRLKSPVRLLEEMAAFLFDVS